MHTKNLTFKDVYKGNIPWLEKHTILAALAGSHAYGTNIETSDIDVRGVCIPPKEYFFLASHNFEHAQQIEPVDLVVFGIHKWMTAAAKCNPNFLELVFTDPKHWITHKELGFKLYDNRFLFLSQLAKQTFSGYAISQLKRIKTHRAWLLNPPKKAPERADYGLEGVKKMSASEMGAFDALERREVDFEISQGAQALLLAEKQYQAAVTQYKQYKTWEKSRNATRFELEAKFGYDTKHAMHLVRLLRMAEEIITEGQLRVHREDAKELLEIREGSWKYDDLMKWAEEKAEFIKKTEAPLLPAKPDQEKLDTLCMELVETSLKSVG